MSIQVQQLTKLYGQQIAVDGITFTANPGRILGFLGPNGAGKSTTMRMLTGYTTPSSGTATVAGFDIISNPIEAKRRIGFLPENTPLYNDMYIKEFLRFVGGMYNLKSINHRINEVIALVGLEKERNKKIGQLSKGYRQRVGFAQAIIHDPEVLILDEPTSGLDPNQMVEVRTLIKSLGAKKTVLLSTHIMQEVEVLCEEVVIIHNGKMVANHSLTELKKVHSETDLEKIFKTLTLS